MPKSQSVRYDADLIVIGGGAAGLMAASTAAEAGLRVLVLEKNGRCGEKLRITGGGRCNITSQTPDVRELLSAYKEAGKFLFAPFKQWDVVATRDWFGTIGVPTKEEAERRVFPVSQSAEAVTEALIAQAKRCGVELQTGAAVTTITHTAGAFTVTVNGDMTYRVPQVVVATGGTSRPETGSTGDALAWLRRFGHTVVTPNRALVPLLVTDPSLVAPLAGVALPAARVTVYCDGKKQLRGQGKVLFTHVGLSGPQILNMSQAIGALLPEGVVTVVLDLVPDIPIDEWEKQLRAQVMASPNKLVRNHLRDYLPASLVEAVCAAADVGTSLAGHELTVPLRRRLVAVVKAYPLTIAGLAGSDKAVVSSGGVTLTEVDFRTMESRLIPGLYVIGDVLNINRPSGGYSLQLCWTTGRVAGMAAARRARP